jgi:hypothetical protein
LRWKLSALWHIPYTDPYWDSLLFVQWKIFAEHLALDEKREFEDKRNMAEYAMGFHNPEAVQYVLSERESEDGESSLEDQSFESVIAALQKQGLAEGFDKEKYKEMRRAGKAEATNNDRRFIDTDEINIYK